MSGLLIRINVFNRKRNPQHWRTLPHDQAYVDLVPRWFGWSYSYILYINLLFGNPHRPMIHDKYFPTAHRPNPSFKPIFRPIHYGRFETNKGCDMASNGLKYWNLLRWGTGTDFVWTVLDDDFSKTFFQGRTPPAKESVCGLLWILGSKGSTETGETANQKYQWAWWEYHSSAWEFFQPHGALASSEPPASLW